MSLQFKKPRNWKGPVVSSAVVLGATYLILKSFPHLQDSIYNFITGYRELDDEKDGTVMDARIAEVDELRRKAKHTAESTSSTDNTSSVGPNDTSPIGGSIVDLQGVSVGDIEEWSNETLKSYLKEVSK